MRAHLFRKITDEAGNLLIGATVLVTDTGRSDPTHAVLYRDPTSDTTLTNPIVTTDGTIDFYMVEQTRVDLGVTPPGQPTQNYEAVDVLSPVEPVQKSLRLQAPDGGTWYITVDNDGTLVSSDTADSGYYATD